MLRSPSKPREVLNIIRDKHVLLISEQLALEWQAVIHRPKFDKYLTLSERLELLAVLLGVTEEVQINIQINACRDANDNHILELGICGQADCIVSSDGDLLTLDPYQGLSIYSVDRFISASSSEL
jgi:hypothetical protein